MTWRRNMAALCMMGALLLTTGCGKTKGFAYDFTAKQAYKYHLSSDETITYDFGQGDVRKLTLHAEKDYQMSVEKVVDGLVSLRVDVTKIHQTGQGSAGQVDKSLPDVSLRYMVKAKTGAVVRVELLQTKDASPESVETLASRYSPANYLPVLSVSGGGLKPGDTWTWDSPGVAMGGQPKGDVTQLSTGTFKALEGEGDQVVGVFQVETTQGTGAAYSTWHMTTRLSKDTGMPAAVQNSATLRYTQLVPLGTKAVQAQVLDQWQETLARS